MPWKTERLCEYGKKPSGSIKGRKSVAQLSLSRIRLCGVNELFFFNSAGSDVTFDPDSLATPREVFGECYWNYYYMQIAVY
jgi:hypothetical protein